MRDSKQGQEIQKGDKVDIYLGEHPVLGGHAVGKIVAIDEYSVTLNNAVWLPIKHIKTIEIVEEAAA